MVVTRLTRKPNMTLAKSPFVKLFLISLLICDFPVEASGAIYKCTSKDGKVQFQDSPCISGAVEKRMRESATRVTPKEAARQIQGSCFSNSQGQREAEPVTPEKLDMLHRILGIKRILPAPAPSDDFQKRAACERVVQEYDQLLDGLEASSNKEFQEARQCIVEKEKQLAMERARIGCKFY